MSLDPTTIGRYRILGTLGTGAMGIVYLAEDPRLHRGVAIKVMRGGQGDPEVLARFQREAEISAQLHHPNVITIYDVGEEEGMGPFLAMEHIDGESLAARLKRGPLPTEEAVGMLLQAKHALDAAHRAGIVHRDLKPENFMVSKAGLLKLMDFGIATGAGPRVTRTSEFLGTPAYAAPELLRGGKADQVSDRWSFAATAFEMLTGALPFPGDSVGTLVFRIVHEPPIRPEGVSDGVWEVFQKALAKEPGARYPDLAAFLRDLLAALDLPESVRHGAEAQLEGSHGAAWAPPIKRGKGRWKWIASGALGFGLAAAAWMLWHRSDPPRRLALLSQPEGAEVFMDGAKLGRTPIKELWVKGENLKLRFEKADYLPLEQEVGPGEQRVEVKLLPAPYQVAVRSLPEGAEVFMDGQVRGVTPLPDLEVPGEGRHVLELRLLGHEDWRMTLARKEPVPDPIHLQRVDAPRPAKKAAKKPEAKAPEKGAQDKKKEEPGKIKKFFNRIFKKD